MPLQRRLVDFSADAPFHNVPKKLHEHYGFELCPEVIRTVTLKHAAMVATFVEEATTLPNEKGAVCLIAQADGGMIPIVSFDEDLPIKDRRKKRKIAWKEARLCFSRDSKKAEAVFRATLGGVDSTGDIWFSSAVAAGMGTGTTVHCIGDGAPWIKEQAQRIFGEQGQYLVDFYHLSEYLAASAHECSEEPKEWLEEQQARLKIGKLYLVLQELEKHLNPPSGDESEPVRACYRYLTNRLDQLDYLGAIQEGLPIGSGEIESGHRHIVQKRMKRAGSWWKEENAEHMLQLLTLRSNGGWDNYWDKYQDLIEDQAA